jgi:hypothetical protein
MKPQVKAAPNQSRAGLGPLWMRGRAAESVAFDPVCAEHREKPPKVNVLQCSKQRNG